MKVLSKNLLKKYGLGRQADAEDKGSGGSGGGAKPKKTPAGRKAMTDKKKEMIKGGSIISLGHQGALQFMTRLPFHDLLGAGPLEL